ncbi:guanine-1-methyltransferase-domain-containing protein [Lineolata rhizophorae]|uniref:tRNA (guanine(9)-N1)-methyltransferase n=1 Tax=Lineolata rhizophorae TaxID=578093 RepID=A0A6A6NZ76_9PEZI|nr:guanine-1-methyltransferase-domain-containing protein [Lineolata rhizophorae]
MDEEERPSKIQKLDHTLVSTKRDQEMANSNGESGTLDFSVGTDGSNPVRELKKTSLPIELNSTGPEEQQQQQLGGCASDDTPSTEQRPAMSKSRRKKLLRQERWEAGREDRKALRRRKTKERRERKRAEKAERANEEDAYTNEVGETQAAKHQPNPPQNVQVPITFLFDCSFDDLMGDKEMKSLALQLTRSYSDNRHARFKAHLAISSFGGKLKERFDTVLAKQHQSWKGIGFYAEDFEAVTKKTDGWMRQKPNGGTLLGALRKSQTQHEESNDLGDGEVVYLTSDSDAVLEELKPYSTYIIGGLVDKNRHKGLCYRRAMEKGVKTAKLPIGEFLEMNSRSVLAINHVSEIMLKWLDLGDWGQAFMEVIPRRKGGVLKNNSYDADDGLNDEFVAGGEDLKAADGESEDAGKCAELASDA